jgi:hypothetical protein
MRNWFLIAAFLSFPAFGVERLIELLPHGWNAGKHAR